jgi:Tfp pilus assembly PilM family ATPase
MTAMHRFNTLTYCQDLERAGMSRQLAEVQALALNAALDHSAHDFATKADLAQGLAALDKEIRLTKSDLSVAVGVLEKEILLTKSDLSAAVITLERKIHETKCDLSSAVTTLEKKIVESEARLEKEIHRSIAPIEKDISNLYADNKIFKWCFGIMIPILLTLLIPVVQGLYKQFVLGQG